MKFATRYLVAAALLAAPVSAAAQTAQPQPQGEHQQHQGRRGERGQMDGRRGPGGGPVQRILAQRQQLGLTANQVARLEAIQRDLQARNAPLHQQLEGLFPERGERGERGEGGRGERPQLTAEQRQQMQQRREQAEPIMQRLRASHEQALAQVREVLSDQQEAQVRQWLERREDHGGRGERRGRGGEQPRGGAGRSR